MTTGNSAEPMNQAELRTLASNVRSYNDHCSGEVVLRLLATVAAYNDRVAKLEAALRELRPADGEHHRVDNGDCMVPCGDESLRWRYNKPPRPGDECQCGLDEVRSKIDALLQNTTEK